MNMNVQTFQKINDLLICVDSDGCAMDTMDVKHKEAFGPAAVAIWGLEDFQDVFLKTWNEINLYTRTRGINRFKGVVQTFAALEAKGMKMPDISRFKKWTEETTELSNPALERAIAKTGDEQLKQALAWSHAVNQTIEDKLAGQDRPVTGAKEGLEAAAAVADVAIVSSANEEAVLDEWNRHGLSEHVDILLGQDAGTKSYCISQLKSLYPTEQMLMVGDAFGDLDAALQNGVRFYPILVGKEAESWARFRTEALPRMESGDFDESYQQALIQEFYANLS